MYRLLLQLTLSNTQQPSATPALTLTLNVIPLQAEVRDSSGISQTFLVDRDSGSEYFATQTAQAK